MAFLTHLRARLDRRNRYLQTLSELESMSDREALDLGLSRADFPRLAREAVYGR